MYIDRMVIGFILGIVFTIVGCIIIVITVGKKK